MTVKELKELIKDLPDDMLVTEQRYSDTKLMDKDDWSIIEVMDTFEKDGWSMRAPIPNYANEEYIARYAMQSRGLKKVLFFQGN